MWGVLGTLERRRLFDARRVGIFQQARVGGVVADTVAGDAAAESKLKSTAGTSVGGWRLAGGYLPPRANTAVRGAP